MSWKGRVVLVAGVGSGLGSAVVSLLASSGASVAGVARGGEALQRLEAAAKSQHWEFLPVEGDMRRQADADHAVRQAVDRFGHLDGVSVNVGHWISGSTLLHEGNDKDWSDGLHDNLDPVYRLGRAAIPDFVKQESGAFVAVAAAPRVRYAGSPSYCAAKAGLIDLIGKLASDYRPHGIRFNAVLPGNMARNADPLHVPAPGGSRLATDLETSPWEVGYAIRYLLSEEARWVTGATLIVDGGLSTGGPEQA